MSPGGAGIVPPPSATYMNLACPAGHTGTAGHAKTPGEEQ